MLQHTRKPAEKAGFLFFAPKDSVSSQALPQRAEFML
jgi:hypothetical protein